MLSPSVLLLTVSTATLVAAQASSAGCTSNSFAIPSWFVSDVSVEGASQTASFNLLNRATNGTTSVACKSGTCTSADKTLAVSIEAVPSSLTIFVNQSWKCNDRAGADRFQFTATGNASLPLRASKPSISLFLIRGTLVSPVTVDPIYANGPTGHDAKDCSTKTPTWIVDSVLYEEINGDGVNSVPIKRLTLQVTNPATGYEASCMAGDFGDADLASATAVPLSCAGTEFQDSRIGRYSISTTAQLNLPSFTFSLQQTWYCDEADPSKPVSLTASGSLRLPLNCESTLVGSHTNQTTCTTASVTVPGTVTAETPLAPYSIQDPVPGRDGCTLTSLFNPKWSFTSFVIDVKKAVSFDVILATQSRGYQYPITIAQGKALADGWFQCEVGEDGGNALPLWPETCTFKYDMATRELELKGEWKCGDLNPENPITFRGTSVTKVQNPLGCKMVGEYQECETDSQNPWTAEIKNVTWGAMP